MKKLKQEIDGKIYSLTVEEQDSLKERFDPDGFHDKGEVYIKYKGCCLCAQYLDNFCKGCTFHKAAGIALLGCVHILWTHIIKDTCSLILGASAISYRRQDTDNARKEMNQVLLFLENFQ